MYHGALRTDRKSRPNREHATNKLDQEGLQVEDVPDYGSVQEPNQLWNP